MKRKAVKKARRATKMRSDGSVPLWGFAWAHRTQDPRNAVWKASTRDFYGQPYTSRAAAVREWRWSRNFGHLVGPVVQVRFPHP